MYKQVGRTDLKRDKGRHAKTVGWRTSKVGKPYFENRANRSDKKKWI